VKLPLLRLSVPAEGVRRRLFEVIDMLWISIGVRRRLRRTTWLLAAFLCFGPVLAAQYSLSRVEPPDVYSIRPRLAFEPRYERKTADRKLITNPDFFCSACARERRIAARTRDDMRDTLEVEHPPAPEGAAGPAPRFGAFRLMQEGGEHVLRYLLEEAKHENPVFIEDGLFRIFTDIEAADCRTGNVRFDHELALLRDVFPELAPGASSLTSHQRAHLYLIRAHEIAADLEAFVDHDPEAESMLCLGPYLGMRQKFEVYVFGAKARQTAFLTAFPMTSAHGGDGAWTHLATDGAMVMAVCEPEKKDVWLHSLLTHRLTFILLVGYRAYRFDMPVWILHGMAHLMERRLRTDFNSFIPGIGLLPPPWRSSSWKRSVAEQAASGKYTRFSDLLRTTDIGAVPMSEHALVWSISSYLATTDRPGFGAFIREMKAMPQDAQVFEHQQRVFKLTLGFRIEDLETRWSKWVAQAYARQ
jgi:hypothetical protein